MHPQDLYNNVKSGFTYNAMLKDFMHSLKGAVETWLWELQWMQIWEQSVGSDGKQLGFYSGKNKQLTTNKPRRKGQKYEMDDTGELMANMKVVIKKGTKEILFINTRTNVDVFRFDQEVFLTSEWFGLTEENLEKFMWTYCYRWCILWTKEHIKYGNNKKTYGFKKPKS